MPFKNVSRNKSLQKIIIIIFSILGLLKLIFENKDLSFLQDYVSVFGQHLFIVFEEYYLFFKIGTFILFILNGFVLTYILRKHKLVELHQYFPCIFYLLFLLFFLTTTFFIPLLVNLLIIIFLLPPFFKISEKNYKEKNGILFGIFCGLIMLMYAPFLLFFFLIYLILILNNFSNWRNYMLPFIGLLITYIYFFSILYFIDFNHFNFLLPAYILQFEVIPFAFFSANKYHIILYSLFIIIYLFFSYNLFSKSASMNIFIRKKYYFLLLSSFFGLLLNCLFKENQSIGLLLFLTLLSSMGGILYSRQK